MKRIADIPLYSIVILSSIGFTLLYRMQQDGYISFKQFLGGVLGLAIGLGISHGIITVVIERKLNER